ncbi:hypothetical protein FKY78_08745 [Enterococcus faecalis]|nr:hypothetical protein [Enterococcus faecalis]TQA38919.1 hypothetical protein FKY78_08745 [Enterococcus faecalis]TQA86035.1 hypothetical protein FKY83_09335 [Enterococcus faecalis]
MPKTVQHLTSSWTQLKSLVNKFNQLKKRVPTRDKFVGTLYFFLKTTNFFLKASKSLLLMKSL